MGLGSAPTVTGSGMWEGPTMVCEACPQGVRRRSGRALGRGDGVPGRARRGVALIREVELCPDGEIGGAHGL